MPTQHDSNSWMEYRRLVLDCLDEQKKKNDDISEDIAEIKLELNAIKIKIGVVAAIAGFAGSLIPVIIQLVIAYH